MAEILTFINAAVPIVGLVAVPFLFARALGPVDLSALFVAPTDGWPRGVQEEEPRRWTSG